MFFFATSAALAAGRRGLPLLLAASLAGCGGPSASTEAPTVPPAASAAHDSVQSSLTVPAPDATGTRADTATQPTPPAPKPLPKPKAALPRPAPSSVAAAPTGAGLVPAASPTPAAEFVAPAPAAPATRTQAGRVLDEAGHPLAGATVMLKGSTQGTSTDANGNYTFEVPGGENTFVVGYGGYEDETATARDGQPLNVTLVPHPSASRSRRGRK